MHFQGLQPLFARHAIGAGIGVPMMLTAAPTRPGGHERFRDATTMQSCCLRVYRVRPKEKARSQFSYVPGFRVSILVLSLEFHTISLYTLCINEMTTPVS